MHAPSTRICSITMENKNTPQTMNEIEIAALEAHAIKKGESTETAKRIAQKRFGELQKDRDIVGSV